MYLKCFGETESFLRSVSEKKLKFPQIAYKDKQGALTPENKINATKLEKVRTHINSFTAYKSHYTRSDTSKKYLSPGLYIAKLYSLYAEKYDNPVS